jgi:hypothetical protein
MTMNELAARRFKLVVDQVEHQLRTHQTVVLGTDRVEDVEEWRSAARAAGRRLGLPVRTGISKDGTRVWASEGP